MKVRFFGMEVATKGSGAELTAPLMLAGPYAKMAGHDINYMALSGVLAMLGRKDGKPYSPANIVGASQHFEFPFRSLADPVSFSLAADFGGGGMMAVVGILMALLERNRSGKGQVVEVDMVRLSLAPIPTSQAHRASNLGHWHSLPLLLPSHDVAPFARHPYLGPAARGEPT